MINRKIWVGCLLILFQFGCSSPARRLSNAVMQVRTFKPPVTDSKKHGWSLGFTENHTVSLSNSGTYAEGDAILPSLNAKIGDRFSLGGALIFGKASTGLIDKTFSTGFDVNAQLQMISGEAFAMYLMGAFSRTTGSGSESGNSTTKVQTDPATGLPWTPTDKWTAETSIELYEQQVALMARFTLSPTVRLFAGPAYYHTTFHSSNTLTSQPTVEQRFDRWSPAAHVLLDFEASSGMALILGGSYVQLQSLGPESQFQKKAVTATVGIDFRF